MIIYLVEISGYNPQTLQVETLYFCTGAGFTTAPGDTPPGTVYEPRVVQPGSLQWSMFDQGATSGKISSGYGEVTLANGDGVLDYLKDWGFDGRTITVKWGDDSRPVSAFSVLYTATMQQAKPEALLLTLVLRDKQYILDRPVQDLIFQGTNIAPDGLEGTPNDIMGKPKPLVLGQVYNVTPVCVNTSKLIYALNIRHGGQFDAEPDVDSLADFDAATVAVNTSSGINVLSVFDKGVAVTRGPDYPDSSTMLANEPEPGTYCVCPSEGYLRFGYAPQGTVTVNCTDAISATVAPTAANLAHQVLNQLLSVTDDQINTDDIAAANAANSATVGIYIDSANTGGSILDPIMASPGFWYGFDRLGMFRIRPITVPLASTIPITLDETMIETYEMLGISDSQNGVPAKRVNLTWRPNYTVMQPADLAGAVDPDTRNQLGMATRQAYFEDATVVSKHLLAGEISFDTLCYNDQTAEAQRRLEIYSVNRDRLQVSLKLRPGLENLLNLGENVTVTLPRFGYDNGLVRKIISFDLDCSTNNLTLVLWG